MFPNVINQKTESVFKSLGKIVNAQDFYLAGGTGLALQLGHRQSIDLDFFTRHKFSSSRLKEKILALGKFFLRSEDQGTLHIVLSEVNVSFLFYSYPLLYRQINFKNNFLADWRDIAAMKIDAISSRGSKKDFIDLYFLLQQKSLAELLKIFSKKFQGINYNKAHILKSLVYFDDAEHDPAPRMLTPVSWPAVKQGLKTEVRKYLAAQ